jgi:hypothetical protein
METTSSAPGGLSADPAQPSRAPGFIPVDPSTQPQTGNTGIQVPDPASNQEVREQYGVGLVLLVLGAALTMALLVGLFMVVARRTWDSNHPPPSRPRHSD